MIAWRPEPASCWIALVPRQWPALGREAVDLARRRLAAWRLAGDQPPLDLGTPTPSDVVYLPPAPPAHQPWRARAAAWASAQGASALVQMATDEPELAPATTSGWVVWDPLASLLRDDLEWTGRLPAGAMVVWPLVGGLTDERARFADACRRLAQAGAGTVQPMALELGAAERRRLYESCARPSPDVYHRLFHGEPPREGEFDRVVRDAGLRSLMPRPPLAGATAAARCNRDAAGMLAEIAERVARAGGDEARVAPFFRAARALDELRPGVDSLAREGNLGFVSGVEEEPRAELMAWIASGVSPLLRSLAAGERDSS